MSWEMFIQGFAIEGTLQPPTWAQIKEAEELLGTRLPQSYVDFIQVVGPGAMTDYLRFHIFGPCPGVGETLRRSPDYENAIEFACDIGNFIYIWNLAERSGVGAGEYVIYATIDPCERDNIATEETHWRVADTFDQFILNWVAQGKHPYFKHRSLRRVFRPPPYWGLSF